MTTLAFDTHKAVKALQAAGADEPLAEAVVATVGEAVGENVATKADLAEVQVALKTEIAEVKTEIAEVKTEIAEVKTEIAEVKATLESDIASVKAELKTDISTLREAMSKSLQDMSKSIQDVYKLMVVVILTITGTIIGTAIALVRYLAP